jgi:hypothetical protein
MDLWGRSGRRYGSEGWGFESLRARWLAGWTKVLVEDLPNLLMRHHPARHPFKNPYSCRSEHEL